MLKNVASDKDGTPYSHPTNVRGIGSEVGGCGGMSTGKGFISGTVTNCPEGQKLDTVSVSRYNSDVFGSTVLDNGSADRADITSSPPSVFAKNNNKPVGTRVPGVLQNAANYPALTRSIHYMQTCLAGTCAQGVRTYKLASALRANYYNRFTGAFTTPVAISTDAMGPDHAALPTRDVPGTLTYMPLFNGVPKTTNYVAKT